MQLNTYKFRFWDGSKMFETYTGKSPIPSSPNSTSMLMLADGIFAGDIVRHNSALTGEVVGIACDLESKGRVIVTYSAWYDKSNEHGEGLMFNPIRRDRMEVIGNVYANPELIPAGLESVATLFK